MDMDVTFESVDEGFFEEFTDYLSDQIEKYEEIIRDSVAFLGWKVANRPYQLAVKVVIHLDEVKDSRKRPRLFGLEIVAEGRNQTKIACRLVDEENDSELGMFVFSEFPSWDYKRIADDIKDSIHK